MKTLLVGISCLALGWGCAGLMTRPSADQPSPIEQAAKAAPGAGALLGGPAGGLVGGGVSVLLTAFYAIYQKATETKRHAKHSRVPTWVVSTNPKPGPLVNNPMPPATDFVEEPPLLQP